MVFHTRLRMAAARTVLVVVMSVMTMIMTMDAGTMAGGVARERGPAICTGSAVVMIMAMVVAVAAAVARISAETTRPHVHRSII